MDFSYQPAEPNGGNRKTFRTTFPGLAVRVNNGEEDHPVHDISSGGVAFSGEGLNLGSGDACMLTLCIAGRPYLADLAAVVVRVRSADCGCVFRALNRRQEIQLDKLILETQKRIIAKIKAARDKTPSETSAEGISSSQLRLDDLHIEEF